MATAMVLSSLVAVGTATSAQAVTIKSTAVKTVTVRADARCTRVGQKVSVRSTQYVCTKVGTSNKWVVNTSTVRANRGCTFAGETALIGASSLFNCYRKSGRLIWKKSGADCKEAYNIWADLQTKYNTNQATLTRLEANVKTLPADQQAELTTTIGIIKTNLTVIKNTADDMNDTVLVMCSY